MRIKFMQKNFSVALKTKLQSLQKLQKSKKICIKKTLFIFNVFIAYLPESD